MGGPCHASGKEAPFHEDCDPPLAGSSGAFIAGRGMGLMMIRFASTAVVVRNGRKAAKWYTVKLGLRLKDKEGHWITVTSKGTDVLLHLCQEETPERGNTGILFLTKDVAKEEKALRKKGVRFTQPTTRESWGTYAMFRDPDGNEFWLMQE